MKKISALILIFVLSVTTVFAQSSLFGENVLMPQKLGDITNIYDCSFSDSFGAIITAGRKVKTIGFNTAGQLGNPSAQKAESFIDVDGAVSIIKVGTGKDFAIALTQGGKLYAWGRNDKGQLGVGDTVDRPTPVVIDGIANVKDIAVGEEFAVAVKYDGSVWAWGDNSYGQLGTGDTVSATKPVEVSAVPMAAVVYAGSYHAGAMTGTAKVYVWGKNDKGQLGLGHTENSYIPTEAKAFATPIDCAFGEDFTAVLKGTGIIHVCGKNDKGQLGLGHTEDVVNVTPNDKVRVVYAIEAGKKHMAAIASSGVVYTWGDNSFGQLGKGDLTDTSLPTRIASGASYVDVKCSGNTTAIISRGGPVYFMGNFVNGGDADKPAVRPEEPALPERPARPAEIKDIGILVNNKWLLTDPQPVIVNSRTLVPMRAIFEELGATLEWDDSTKTATAFLGDKTIKVTIGADTAYVNGTAISLDCPAAIVSDRTMVPIRFVSESLGYKVDWEDATRTVIITR